MPVLTLPLGLTTQVNAGAMQAAHLHGTLLLGTLGPSMTTIAPEQLLAEVEDVLRPMPPWETIRHNTLENLPGLGEQQRY